MNRQNEILLDRIYAVIRRRRNLILLRGGAMVIIAVIAALAITFLSDTIFQLGNSARLFLLGAGGAIVAITFFLALIRPLLHTPSADVVARFIEEKHPQLEDRLVTAVELGESPNPRISPQILDKLLDDARFHIEPINLPKTLRTQTAMLWATTAGVLAVLAGALMYSKLDYFLSHSDRIFTPWKIPTVDLSPRLSVAPGSARIPRGAPQEIRVETLNFEAENVILYYSTDDSTWNKSEMDPAGTRQFLFSFFDVQQPTKYYAKADDRLSEIFSIYVYDPPQIKRVDISYTYPDYTGLKPQTEIDAGDVWAPEGTTIKITAVADKPLKQGQIILGDNQALRTTISADTLVTATLTVTVDTHYKISITDTDGLSNDPPSEYYVHALPDQAPTLTIEKPGRDVKATMVEEVPVEIHVQDDYGLSSLKLFYTVNGGEEQSVALLPRKSTKSERVNELQEFAANHLFYFEDLSVQPGDFLTYYVQANDLTTEKTQTPVTTEIQFIEIRPFEQEFFRPLSQEGMGSGGGAVGRLSQVQKNIIVATWKVINRKDKLTEAELFDNINVLSESQKNLLEVTQSTLLQMEQRAVLSGESADRIGKFYSEAIKHMSAAAKKLNENQLREALTPERESYQNLLRAEAEITEVQLQRMQASGAGDAANLEELSQLFDEEMDKLKNKYETLNEAQQQQSEKEVNEALEKVKELARRQEQYNQRLRDLARNQMAEEERKRQIEELRRQQEDLRRETQELSRQVQSLQRQNASIPRDVQDSLRRTESEMNNSSNNLRQQNAEQAAATGQRALNNLKRLENSLQRNQKESLRKNFDALDQQFQELAESQQRLTDDVEKLSRGGEQSQEHLQQARDDQQRLQEDLADAKEALQSLTEKAQQAKNQVTRDVRKFSQDLERSNLEQKMDSAQKLLEEKQLHSAAQAERDIQNALERMREKFTRMRGGLAESEEEKLDLALDQTRQVRENLENLEREMQDLKRQASGSENSGQQTSGQGKENAQAGPEESHSAPNRRDRDQADALNNGLARNLRDLEMLRQSIEVDTSLSRRLENVHQNLQGVVRNFAGGDPNRLTEIEAQVLNPLRTLEAELAQKLDLLRNKEKLFLAQDEKIPAEYEELVKKYYEALSKTK